MREPRNTNRKYLRHVSIRTEQAMLLLQPDAQINQLVGGVIAKYQGVYGILVYAYIVLGNHIHMLVRQPKRNLWRFEQAVNREVAKRVNKLRKRQGHFWGRRYDEQICSTEEDALAALIYILLNPVNHGLVEHPLLWPGLNCFQQLRDGEDRFFPFVNYTAYETAKKRAKKRGGKVSIKDFSEEHPLHLTPLPQFKKLSQEERWAAIQDLLVSGITRIKKERKAKGLGFLGRDAILKQRHSNVPRNVKHSPKPICYAKTLEVKKLFLEWYIPWRESYREASRRFRQGEFLVQFPEDCLHPPLHYSLQN